MRVLRNSVTDECASQLRGKHPDRLPREVVGFEDERPIYKYSTDSPLRLMTGDFEKMDRQSSSLGAMEDLETDRRKFAGKDFSVLCGRDHIGILDDQEFGC